MRGHAAARSGGCCGLSPVHRWRKAQAVRFILIAAGLGIAAGFVREAGKEPPGPPTLAWRQTHAPGFTWRIASSDEWEAVNAALTASGFPRATRCAMPPSGTV